MKFLSLTLACAFFFPLFAQTYWQQEVNYTIKVSLDDKEHTLSAFESLEYINNSPDHLDKIYMHLWPNAYRNGKTALARQLYKEGQTVLPFGADSLKGAIDNLDFKVNGQSVKWEYDKTHQDICILYLNEPLRPGGKLTLTTPFNVKIPSGEISRLGHIGQSYQITQWYPKPAVYDKNGWNEMPYLNQGEFYSEFGSFDVTITLPKNYVVGATGDLQTQSEIDFLNSKAAETQKRIPDLANTANDKIKSTSFPISDSALKTIRYVQTKVHDFAWFADKRYAVLKGEVELPQSRRSVTSWAMFVPSNAEDWQHAIEYINDGIFYYSKWNGDYPYNQVTAVDGTISAGGGMEYPNVTVIGSTSSKEELEVVIVHEVGHNWFYGILGSNERIHGWMDEGINTLNEVRYVQTKYPNNTRMSDMVLGGRFHLNDLDHHDLGDISYRSIAAIGEDQPIETHSAEFTSTNYGIIMYQKTGLVFYYLKDYLGEELFDKCMHAYFEEWKFKHPQPEDMRLTLERTSGKNLSWLFDDLINTTNHIDYKLKSVKNTSTGKLVTVKNVGQVDGPIEVNAYKDGQLIDTIWAEPGEKKTTLELKAEANEIRIDGALDIPEINRGNNNWHEKGIFGKCEKTKFEFLFGDNEANKKEVFWTPVIAGNYYDKIMIGAAFHNMGVPFNKFQYLVAPMYSFGRGNISGIGEFSYTMLPKTTLKLSRLGLSIKSFKMVETADNKKSSGAYLALSPFWYTKIGNRTSSIFDHSVLIQGIAKYNIYNVTTKDYLGAFAKYNITMNLPEHQASINLRSDYIRSDLSEMARLMLDATYKYKYLKNSMKRWAEIRFFAGNTFHYRNFVQSFAEIKEYRFAMSLNGSDGAQDLFFEDYYFGRGQISGIWSQQRQDDMGGFKTSSWYGSTTNWMATTNLYVQLPVPRLGFLGAYADAGIFSNGVSINSAFDAGVGIRISKVFGVYFPIWMSKELADSFGNSSYSEKIKFVLRMNIVNKGLSLSSLFN